MSLDEILHHVQKKSRPIIYILSLVLLLRIVTALFLTQPGYMDAYYYYNAAESLYQGQGFTDHVIWNYLSDPRGLPQPACLYWMPLTSLVIYPFFVLFGDSFRVAQIPFILLSTVLVWLTYRLSLDLGTKRQSFMAPPAPLAKGAEGASMPIPRAASPAPLAEEAEGSSMPIPRAASPSLLAEGAEGSSMPIPRAASPSPLVGGTEGGHPDVNCAVLAAIWMAFAGFYTVFWVTLDSFALFAVVAGLALYAAGRGLRDGRVAWFVLAGGFAGLAHLTRADGPLVLVAVLLALCVLAWRRPPERGRLLRAALVASIAYLVVVFPWLYRNWRETGFLMGSGGTQALFLRDYDELFSYGRELSFTSYLEWGWSAILQSKLQGLWFGVQNLLVVNLMIFLTPFAAWGLWVWRKRSELLPFVLYAALVYLSMTLLFTYPGMRGGLLHSSTALLPWLFAAAACGLREFIRFMAAHRSGWNPDTAYRFFFVAFILLAALLSGFLFLNNVSGRSGQNPPWNERNTVYIEVGEWLAQNHRDVAPVMVNNAPAFYYFVHRPALSIPNEAPDTVIEAARRYGVEYLVLEADHPAPLKALYEGRETIAGMELVAGLTPGESVKIYYLERSR